MNFVMIHAPGAGSIAQPVNQQSSMLPLYHGCPLTLVCIRTDLSYCLLLGAVSLKLLAGKLAPKLVYFVLENELLNFNEMAL